MGGLLSRTAVASSGDKLWNNVFMKSPEDLQEELDEETLEELDQLLHFERKPYIERVIFVAVPHRGSPMAEGFLASIGKSLIGIPLASLNILKKVTDRVKESVRPEMQEKLASEAGGNSLTSLSPNSPVIQALSEIAVDNSVPFHSIIGNVGEEQELERASDGVVPYASAHLEGAESELIVPAGHGAHEHPLAMLEIRRIAKLHLEELQKK